MDRKSDISKIINEIDKTLEIDGSWSLDIGKVAFITGRKIQELYSDLYKIHETRGQELVVDCFCENSVHELLLLLEECGYDSAESGFASAGIFLDHNLQTEVYTTFIAIIKRTLESHTIDYKQYIHILETLADPNLAAEKYVNENFNRSSMIKTTAEEFVETTEFIIPHSAVVLAARYLELLFIRHVIHWGQFFYHVQQQLTDFYFSVLHPEKKAAINAENIPDIVRKAMELFNLKHNQLEKSEIRRKYRSMMKKYHPDINPDGEEMSKKLIKAYAVLCSFL